MRYFQLAAATALTLAFGSSPAALAADTCAYVIGDVEGKGFSTPAVVIPVGGLTLYISQIQAHIDATHQEILGYTLTTPALTSTYIPYDIMVPYTELEIPAYSSTMQGLHISTYTCVSAGVATPAIPIYVPSSTLNTPGFYVNTPTVVLNLLGKVSTFTGKYFEYGDNTVVIPAYSNTIPAQNLSTPSNSVTVDLNGAMESASCLMP